VPGVEAAATSQHSLLGGDWGSDDVRIPASNAPMQTREPARNGVGPGFFATLRIPILRGRAIDEQDVRDARPVCVINAGLARTYFGKTDPLGQTVVRIDSQTASTPFTVVGIAADARYADLWDPDPPTYYIPFTRLGAIRSMMFALRSRSPPAALGEEIRAAVRSLDPNLPVTDFQTQLARDQTSVGSEQLLARLGGCFAFLGLLLAAIGIEGTMAYAVARRTRDIGVQMALGADRAQVLRGVLRETLLIAGAGVAAGLSLALALGPTLASQLYGVTAHDPATLLGAAAVLMAVALGAGWLPARRAASVDPVVALRCE
jgi:predicted permease